MTEKQLYDEAFCQMGEAPLEIDEAQPIDRRRFNRGTVGNKGGRPAKRKTLIINGVTQDGHWRLVDETPETIIIESADRTRP